MGDKQRYLISAAFALSTIAGWSSVAHADTCELTKVELDHEPHVDGFNTYALVEIGAEPTDTQRSINGQYSTIYFKYRNDSGNLRSGSGVVIFFGGVIDEGERSNTFELDFFPFLSGNAHITRITSLRSGSVYCGY